MPDVLLFSHRPRLTWFSCVHQEFGIREKAEQLVSQGMDDNVRKYRLVAKIGDLGNVRSLQASLAELVHPRIDAPHICIVSTPRHCTQLFSQPHSTSQT